MRKRSLLKILLAATVICVGPVFAEGGSAVKGNPDSKVYHLPTCKYYSAKNTTVEFKSEAAAQEAGYKACKVCGKGAAADQNTKKK